jgi:arylsulfatase A-like enzyme
MNITRRIVLTTACCALGALPAGSATVSVGPSPAHGNNWVPPPGALNVLMIVLDDVGTDQLKIYGLDPGQPVTCPSVQVTSTPTPTINLLRNTGVMYARAYANALCSPTRATILCGRYGMRVGVGAAIDRGANFTVSNTEIFLPELIRDYNAASYARGAFGKWHLADNTTRDAHAAENGFQKWQGTKGNIDDFYTWIKVTAEGGALGGSATSSRETISPAAGAAPSTDTFVSSVTRRDAAAWINQQTGPFFSYVCFNPPHAPFQVPPTNLLSKKTRSKLAALGYEPGERAGPLRSDQILIYQANLEAIDREIFELLVAIAPKLPYTMVVVVGDNGTPAEVVQDPAMSGKSKRTNYEGGTRVPLVISGPLTWFRGGRTCRSLVGSVDLWRTVANFTGISNATVDAAVAGTGLPYDSLSFLEQVLEPNRPGPRTFAYSELFPNGPPPVPANVTWLRAMTDGTYRYLRRRGAGGGVFEELYDIPVDPCQTVDLTKPPHVMTPAETAALAAMRAAMDAL